jgi:lipopolysaccharide export system protein LptA
MRSLLLLLPLVAHLAAAAQERNTIELLGARDLKYDKRMGVEAQRLIGDVRFRHKGALMWCDSAYLYSATNSLDAYGNVRILQGDTLQLTGQTLYYDGNTQLVRVRGAVTLRDAEMTLTTDHLDFDRRTGHGVYREGGNITSTANQNVLTSTQGHYDSQLKRFRFRNKVVLTNPRYRVETDTLNYDNLNEVAYFLGPTYIYSDENTIYCENGWYDTRSDKAQFNENAWIDNGKQLLHGDSLWYSRNDALGRAWQNVSLLDRPAKYMIMGQQGTLYEAENRSVITDQAYMLQYDNADTLYLAADTLMAVNDSIAGNNLYAYRHVRFYRTDLQGATDSLVYARTDSIIYLYRTPMIWSDRLQITSDTMELHLRNNRMHRLYAYQNAFMADSMQATMYQQIKGRRLTGYFAENELYKVLIEGNAQSIYYAEEESKPAPGDKLPVRVKNVMGANKSMSSRMAIFLENRRVQTIRFLVKPSGRFIPLPLLSPDEATLEGFTWHGDKRPADKNDLWR